MDATVFDFLKNMKKEYSDKWWSIREIAEKLNISPSSVTHSLKKPREIGLIKHKKTQRYDYNDRLQNINVYQY